MKSKFSIYLVLLFLGSKTYGQFPSTFTTWSTPQAGEIKNNNLLGYNVLGGTANSAIDNTSSQSWSLVDINGDGKPDLVVTGDLETAGNTQFNVATAPIWKVYLNNGTGFSSTATSWSTPTGGEIKNNNLLGYNSTNGIAVSTDNTTSQTWALVDMNGDGKPDLVVMGDWETAGNTEFSAATSPYWNVYLNTGSGFSATATSWSTPAGGGEINNNNLLGYNAAGGTASSSVDNNSSQCWSLVDMNGDGKPDLVVTAALQTLGNTQFNAATTPDWQVYLNTGSGFSSTATTWSTPQAGEINNNNLLGYNGVAGTASSSVDNNGSQCWSLVDLNGDGKPDLVVTAALQTQGNTQFNAATTPDWQVYINNGSGFSSTATTWSTPQGGQIQNNNLLGYNGLSGFAIAVVDNTSSQTWSVLDLNGDGKPDLVVTGDLEANGNTQFNAATTPDWQVYMNTGSGFSSTATNWGTPTGGVILQHNLLGYNAVGGTASAIDNTSSQTWSVVDMNGDFKPDLVVCGDLEANGNTQFNAATTPDWQVYLNQSTTVTGLTPQQGKANGCTIYPNPNTGNFTLQFTDDAVKEIEITDLVGRAIIASAKVERQMNFSDDQLPTGIYIIRIAQNGETKSLKFTVLK